MEGVSVDTCKANMAGLQRGIDHNADEIKRVDRTAEKRLDAHAEDIDGIKDTMSTIAATQKVIASTQEKLADMQKQHDQRIAALEGKGGKRWEKVVETALVAIVSAVIGALAAGFLPR